MYPIETRRALRLKYIQGISLRAAARAVQVPYQTARAWKVAAKNNGDDWDHYRAVYKVSADGSGEVLDAILHELTSATLATGIALRDTSIPVTDKVRMQASLADSFSKIGAAIGKINPQVSRLATAMEVIKIMHAVVQERRPDLLDAFVGMLDEVGEKVNKRYG